MGCKAVISFGSWVFGCQLKEGHKEQHRHDGVIQQDTGWVGYAITWGNYGDVIWAPEKVEEMLFVGAPV